MLLTIKTNDKCNNLYIRHITSEIALHSKRRKLIEDAFKLPSFETALENTSE